MARRRRGAGTAVTVPRDGGSAAESRAGRPTRAHLPLHSRLPAVRVILGVTDDAREKALLDALEGAGGYHIRRRLLASPLLDDARADACDAVIVSADLTGLTATRLRELAGLGVPTVLLVDTPDPERWRGLASTVLPSNAPAEEVVAGLAGVLRIGRVPATREPSGAAPDDLGTPAEPSRRRRAPLDGSHAVESGGAAGASPDTDHCLVVTVASGGGSPGRSTVAVGLAARLGAEAPTLLVDADLAAPAVAALLDLDPRRNIHMLAGRQGGSARAWEDALAEELQPLGPASPHLRVLCGILGPADRRAVDGTFLERLLARVAGRFRYVVVDVGAELASPEFALHQGAVALADEVLLVASPEVAGLHRVREALAVVRGELGVPADRVHLVLNRFDRRVHTYGIDQIEWNLGQPLAAVVPDDPGGVGRALAAQRPVVFERRSRAGRALNALARRVHGEALAPLTIATVPGGDGPRPLAGGPPTERPTGTALPRVRTGWWAGLGAWSPLARLRRARGGGVDDRDGDEGVPVAGGVPAGEG